MIVIAALLAGALAGALIARRRGGKTADILHHAAIYAIVAGLIGTFLTLLIDRMI